MPLKKGHILVVDDELSMRDFLSVLLKKEKYAVDTAESGEEALALLEKGMYDVMIIDLVMPGMGGQEVLEKAKRIDPELMVIIITAYGSIGSAIEAIKAGAYDYLPKPFKIDELQIRVQRAIEKRNLTRENIRLRRELQERYQIGDLVGASPRMLELYSTLHRIKDAKTNVLILGESGTGKELVARAIHYNGIRKKGPFVVVNCAAIPEPLLESELFGHKRGSFTGAVSDRVGLFESAQGGSVFLDEIGELPLSLQVKLLRVLQEKTIRPVGGTEDVELDVRVLAASNKDLEEEVKRGRFREDLFYRLNVIQLRVPPLRERREDIPMLAQYFLEKYARESSKPIQKISKEAMAWLMGYAYSGNVRELENIIERAVALEATDTILLESVQGLKGREDSLIGESEFPSEGVNLEMAVSQFERNLLVGALQKAEGVKKKAAELLQISFRSLRYRLAKLGLD